MGPFVFFLFGTKCVGGGVRVFFFFWGGGLKLRFVVFWWFRGLFCFWFLPFASLWRYVKRRTRHPLVLLSLFSFPFDSLRHLKYALFQPQYHWQKLKFFGHIWQPQHPHPTPPPAHTALGAASFSSRTFTDRRLSCTWKRCKRIWFGLVCFFPGQQVVGLLFLLLLTLRKFLAVRNVCVGSCLLVGYKILCSQIRCLCSAFS